MQFPGIRHGTLDHISIVDLANQTVDYVLVLFDAIPTDIVDNATFDIADADMDNIIFRQVFNAGDRWAFTDNAVHMINKINLKVRSTEQDGDLWAFLYTTGTPTFASTSDIVVTLWVEH